MAVIELEAKRKGDRIRALQERGALAAACRTADVDRKVRDAMKQISKEIAVNNQCYPRGGQEITKKELARRAGVHQTTIHGPHHEQLLKDISIWLMSLRVPSEGESVQGKKSIKVRLEEANEMCARLKQSERDTNLAVQQLELSLEKALEQIESLRSENQSLQAALNAAPGKVISIGKGD